MANMNRNYNERQVLRLGRALRRISRTTKDLLRDLNIAEDEIRIPRKKKKPAGSGQKAEA